MSCAKSQLAGGGKAPRILNPSHLTEEQQLEFAIAQSIAENKKQAEAIATAKQALIQQLPSNLRLEAVLGDGNCLFRALCRSLISSKSSAPDHVQLRAECIQAIQRNPVLHATFFDHQDFQDYISEMQVDGAYGDELCIRAFCIIYKCSVTVFTAQHGPRTFGDQSLGLQFYLAHNGINHFDAVLPRPHRNYLNHVSGPASIKAEHSISSSPKPVTEEDPPRKHNTLKLLSINVNSWVPRRDSLLQQADILVVQETRLTAAGQRSNHKLLHTVHGSPCPPVSINRNGRKTMATASSHAGRQGGVGIFTKQAWPLLPCVATQETAQLSQVGRWTHAAVPLGTKGGKAKRFLHIISFYNVSGRDQGVIRTNRNRFLTKVFNSASGLGQQPVLLCMDANSSLSASHTMSVAVASGRWFDLGSHFTNNNPAPTFGASKKWDKVSWTKGVTRPDFIFANSAALGMCETFAIRRDLSPRGHLGLEITLNLSAVRQAYRVLKMPVAFPEKVSASAEQKASAAKNVLNRRKSEFEEAKHDPDLAWLTFSSIAEDYLRIIHSETCHQGEGGRHKSLHFKQMTTTQAATSKRRPTEVGTAQLTKFRKIQCQSIELRTKILRIMNTTSCSQQDAHDHEVLTKSLQDAARYLGCSLRMDFVRFLHSHFGIARPDHFGQCKRRFRI